MILSTVNTFDNNCSALIAGSPKRLFFKLLTTNTRWLLDFPLYDSLS